ncbi:fimbria/pilus periplasmic chaperone [Enterobacter sp. 118C5]|uniref:fimbria/pilus periplasmic chaperone n=1 Tax=Enterobacter TaxID=547 RepID=UPI002A831596|nr:fimbria/pilus periplasmic chaperone [Enterobacter sp. 118C5]
MIKLLAAVFLTAYTTTALAGVSIGGTRFIYSEKARALTVLVMNSSAEIWLINTHITSGGTWNGVRPSPQPAPFIIAPPLFALKGKKQGTLRILKTAQTLRQDRETLFTLSIAAIPAGNATGNSVQVAPRSLLKLFYRPMGLQGKPQDASKQLRWRQVARKVEVNNPTPYYVTLVNLNVNGLNVRDPGMVAPFSTRQLAECDPASRCILSWQSINDYGRMMPKTTVELSDK